MSEPKFSVTDEMAEFIQRHPHARSSFIMKDALAEIETLRSRLRAADEGGSEDAAYAERLRAALEWYAKNLGESRSKDMRIIVQDGGKRARAALAGERSER